jgi:hypothetical protein
MAVGVDFPEKNFSLIGSPEDRAAGTVYDLHAYKYQDLDGNWHVISKWRFSPEELLEIRRTGAVWFHCWGKTHPPIRIEGISPFEEKKDGTTSGNS